MIESIVAILLGGLAGFTSVSLYAAISPQWRLQMAAECEQDTRRALLSYDGPLDGLWPLLREQFATAGLRLRLTLLPALIGTLPVMAGALLLMAAQVTDWFYTYLTALFIVGLLARWYYRVI